MKKTELVDWRSVMRVLQSDQARSSVLDHYRAAGFTPDGFRSMREAEAPTRRSRAREAMIGALTAAEDLLEVNSGAKERLAVREVRRRLEVELWG